jgi:ubiquinol-cytochrome c reductase iron-sulfur subunit
MTEAPAHAADVAPRADTRRGFLYGATAAVGAVGLGAAAWPLIDQLNPDARTRAAGDVVMVDLTGLHAGQQRVVRWHDRPIFVVRRTEAMLQAMQAPQLVAAMTDPRSQRRQQPVYAANPHRSIDPAYAVLLGVCTYCGCVPRYLADGDPPTDPPGGYICECCTSHYDAAGRAHHGAAQLNLPVPPYEMVGATTLRIGTHAGDPVFSLESIERL